MATKSASLQKKLDTLKKALGNKFIPASQKEKLKTQIDKIEKDMSSKKSSKSSKSAGAKASISKLDKLIKNKKYGVYKGAGVDLKKDGERPAKPIGKRKSKSGATYYEYRANRIDVKQPSKKAPYPKLAKGGYMAKGGEVKVGDILTASTGVQVKVIEYDPMFGGRVKVERIDEYATGKPSHWMPLKKFKFEDGGYMAKGGMSQGYDDKEDERLAMEYGKISSKDLDSTYARRDDARFEERMAKGGETADSSRMYNFLKDDLAELEKAIKENNQEEIEKFFSYWNYHLSSLEPKTGSKRMYEFLKDDLVGLEAATKELPSSKEETDRFFSYWDTHLSSLKPKKMEKGGYMAEGGVTEKDVVDSNAQMVLSQIKAVKHHADELSRVVSMKSNIEAWVVGKIERASTGLSDITHYLEGNKQMMSMGGSVRYYTHKMDKK